MSRETLPTPAVGGPGRGEDTQSGALMSTTHRVRQGEGWTPVRVPAVFPSLSSTSGGRESLPSDSLLWGRPGGWTSHGGRSRDGCVVMRFRDGHRHGQTPKFLFSCLRASSLLLLPGHSPFTPLHPSRRPSRDSAEEVLREVVPTTKGGYSIDLGGELEFSAQEPVLGTSKLLTSEWYTGSRNISSGEERSSQR